MRGALGGGAGFRCAVPPSHTYTHSHAAAPQHTNLTYNLTYLPRTRHPPPFLTSATLASLALGSGLAFGFSLPLPGSVGGGVKGGGGGGGAGGSTRKSSSRQSSSSFSLPFHPAACTPGRLSMCARRVSTLAWMWEVGALVMGRGRLLVDR